MSVVQMSPCVVVERWSEFVEWAARTFDMPVACRYDEEGWARLATSSPGVTVMDKRVFAGSQRGNTVVELEVPRVARALAAARANGGKVITGDTEVAGHGRHAAVESPQGVVLWLWEAKEEGRAKDEVHRGPVHFTVDRFYKAPPARVFEAITRARHVENFFVDKAGEDIQGPGEVTWSWKVHGPAQLNVMEYRLNEYVAFRWRPGGVSYQTRTQFSVVPVDGQTHLSITESGWDTDARGLKSAFSHCEGWTSFVDNLGVYLEHDLKLMKV